MIAVIQRVSEASVKIDHQIKSSINRGLLILLGVSQEDNEVDLQWLVGKIAQMRIFGDSEGKMNLSVSDINGELLIVSQFTLLASTKKGNRPSFINAASPEKAIPLYENFIKAISQTTGIQAQTGTFGADMKVSLVNDGPVTIIIDSKNRI